MVTEKVKFCRERKMLRGIADYLSYHATAQFMDNDRHLADFFFKRSNAEEDVSSEKVRLVYFFQEHCST